MLASQQSSPSSSRSGAQTEQNKAYLVNKCSRFFKTLLLLSIKQSCSTYDSVKQLVKVIPPIFIFIPKIENVKFRVSFMGT